MTEKKVWFITGAGRGMGVDITKAALAAGNAVVATGRNTDRIRSVLGEADDLLVVKLDITDPADAQAAAQAAMERFGRIDVLVNNAGNFIAGFFEEIGPEQFRWQIETNLFGPMNVTRALLPIMRRQRSGLVVAISSTAGIVGQEFCSAYSSSKFGIEGWIESLTPEVARFGIEYDLGAQVPKLLRGEHDTGAFFQIGRDQRRHSRLILWRAVGIHEQPCGAVTDDFRREAITILNQHLCDIRRNIEGKLHPVFHLVGWHLQR